MQEWAAWELGLAGLAWVWAGAAGQMVGLLIHPGLEDKNQFVGLGRGRQWAIF